MDRRRREQRQQQAADITTYVMNFRHFSKHHRQQRMHFIMHAQNLLLSCERCNDNCA